MICITKTRNAAYLQSGTGHTRFEQHLLYNGFCLVHGIPCKEPLWVPFLLQTEKTSKFI